MKPLTEAECIERDNVMRETLRHLKEEAALRREIARRAACYDDLLAMLSLAAQHIELGSNPVRVSNFTDEQVVAKLRAAIARAKGGDNAQ